MRTNLFVTKLPSVQSKKMCHARASKRYLFNYSALKLLPSGICKKVLPKVIFNGQKAADVRAGEA
jgi:hypothetical protein